MINKYYQQELSHLKELAVEFSKAHPALAPMLSGPTSDPDVERLLEGTAFLSGMIREKLDDQLPEILHSLLQLIFPHYLRPIPSTTIMQFTPKVGLMETLSVKAGAGLASIPVDGTSCMFTTCYDVDVHPLEVTDAVFEQSPGAASTLTLHFSLKGMNLSAWRPDKLRFLLAGSYEIASDRYLCIMNATRRVTVQSGSGGTPLILGKDALKPVGFEENEALLSYPSNSFPGYRLLQEYFILPHKFLFIDVTGLENWVDKGTGSDFTITFEFGKLPEEPPTFKKQHFVLFATPAINLFKHGAEPILLDHRFTEYRVRPSDMHGENFQVYSVENVIGYEKGTVRQREYSPFEMFRPRSEHSAVYHVNHKISPVGENMEIYLSVSYPPDGPPPAAETLSLDLLCSNAYLAEKLQLGDISQPTETSPGLVEFKNIHPPTASVQPPLGRDLLWRLLSHMSLNFMSIANGENLRAMLRLYIFPDTRNRASVVANNKRVDGILNLSNKPTTRLKAGMVFTGREVVMESDGSHFASTGDLFLFGEILDRFLASYSSINTFTQFKMQDRHSGEQFAWPTRIGDRPLI